MISGGRRRRPAVYAVGACLVTVTLGFLLKGQCLAPWSGGIQYSHLCYNDIQPLYVVRDIRGTFPYVHGGLVHGQLVGGAVEYPVLTGMFMWLTARLASSVDQYLVASALLLMPWALITAYLLARLTGRRAYLWAAAPALVLYSIHNWDLLAVAAATAGFYELSRRKPVGAAALFGIGAAFKLYPGFFLLPLVTALWLDGQRGRAAAAAGAGAGIFAVINLPFLLVSFSGWAATYRFHEQRAADYNSIWHWMAPGLSVGTLNTVTGALTAASFALALVTGAVRYRRERVYPVAQVSGAMVAAFLLWSKVHSPQYALWLLPFFCMLRVNVRWWVAYSIADLAVYVGIFRWFYDLAYRHVEMTWARELLVAGIFLRAGLLAVLFGAFLASRSVKPLRRASQPWPRRKPSLVAVRSN